jgi:hypothetical protein
MISSAMYSDPRLSSDAAASVGAVHELLHLALDPRAGEIGAVYQACNWLSLGVAMGRTGGKGRWWFFDKRESRWRSDRLLSRRKLKLADLRSHPDWIARFESDKGRYVWFEGDRREKRDLRRKLKYPAQPYPKRFTPSPAPRS